MAMWAVRQKATAAAIGGVPMVQAITGFRQDKEGGWVAELVCLHSQHMRHDPPFQSRPWVIDASGRQARVGTGDQLPAVRPG